MIQSKHAFSSGGKQAAVYVSASCGAPLVVFSHFSGDGENIAEGLCALGCECSLLVVSELDWSREMSPWESPPLFKGDTPCTGGADAYLATLTGNILPEILSRLSAAPFLQEDDMEIRRDGIRILKNPQRKERPKAVFTEEKAQEALRFHRSLPAYGETALRSLDALAKSLRLGGIFVKDESGRFGLNAFKGLGGSYALFRLLCERFGLDPRKTNFADLLQEPYRTKCRAVEFTTATDGNHGRGVSWAAGLFGCRAHVFMPAGSAEARRRAIEEVGFEAEAVITPYNYDGAVAHAARLAEENGWVLVQDTSW